MPKYGMPRGKRLIPWEKVSDQKLESQYKYFQAQELKHMNISYASECKRHEIEREAKRRGVNLIGIKSEYHDNERILMPK